MNLPSTLAAAIDRCLDIARQDSSGDVALNHRQIVLAALGPRLERSQRWGGAGHYRRTILDIQTVRHVLPIWKEVWPKDTAPEETLELAERILESGTYEMAQADAIGNMWTYYKNKSFTYSERYPFHLQVFVAAITAAERAGYDLEFDPDALDPTAADGYPTPFDTDASFNACVAYAGGLPWQPSSDVAKRREFWEWWLREAVPAAWASYPPAE